MKLVQLPHVWLVSESKDRQAKRHVLSVFPSASLDSFSRYPNKLPSICLYCNGAKGLICYTKIKLIYHIGFWKRLK